MQWFTVDLISPQVLLVLPLMPSAGPWRRSLRFIKPHFPHSSYKIGISFELLPDRNMQKRWGHHWWIKTGKYRSPCAGDNETGGWATRELKSSASVRDTTSLNCQMYRLFPYIRVTLLNNKANLNWFCPYQAGHHVQEDCGEELGGIISRIISKSALF